METAGEAIELRDDGELHNTHSYIPHKQPGLRWNSAFWFASILFLQV